MPEETERVEYRELPVKCLEFHIDAGVMTFAPHWHSRFEILQIDSGSMHLTVDGQSFTARGGDAVCICPRCSHEGHSGEDGVAYRVIMFELSKMEDALPATSRYIRPLLSGEMRLMRYIQDAAVTQEIDTLTAEFWQAQPSVLLLEGQMYRLLGQLCSRYIDTSFSPRTIDRRLRLAMDYIDSHYTEPLSAAKLADRFHYEESYFCRRFRQQTGLSPVSYVHSLRLSRAIRLLSQTDLTVEEIALRCGYDNVSYFIRRFRQQYGITPGQWRMAGLG